MKKTLKLLMIAGAILLVVLILFWLQPDKPTTYSPLTYGERQYYSQTFTGSGLLLLVETDKKEYNYDEYIHVTARLSNTTEEAIRIRVPNGRGYHHELETTLVGSDGALYDVDYAFFELFPDTAPELETEIMTLMPGEEYIQCMRFSTYMFNNYQSKYPLFAEVQLSDGQYQGTVTAYVLNEHNIQKKFTVDFSVIILPEN